MALSPAEHLQTLSSVEDVADFFGISKKRLNYHLYWSPSPYREFDIPKRGGGVRRIEAPPTPVLFWQRHLAQALADVYAPKKTAHGFIKGRSIVTNAKRHMQRDWVLNVDLKDFFHAIHFGRVLGVFRAHPFLLPDNVAAVLAHLCCYDKRLPMGGPASPVLANLVCRGLDLKLSKYAKAARVEYTRYADDITFSLKRGDFPSEIAYRELDGSVVVGHEVRTLIEHEGFSLNDNKTRLMHRTARQDVTGLTTNERLNVRRDFIRSVRGALHDWETCGYSAANKRFQTRYDDKPRRGEPPELSEHVGGKLAYLSMVRGTNDPVSARYRLQYARLTEAQVVLEDEVALVRNYLAEAVWLVLALDGNGDAVSNGTATFIDGVGFVTSHHAVDPASSDGSSFVVAHSARPSDHFEVAAVRGDRHFDLAVLSTPTAKPAASLRLSTESIQVEDDVILAGFPNWIPGAEIRIERGHVTERRRKSLRDLVQTTCDIYSGNSGGPLLDARGRVAGFATYDRSSPLLPNSSISSRHLDDILSLPATVLGD